MCVYGYVGSYLIWLTQLWAFQRQRRGSTKLFISHTITCWRLLDTGYGSSCCCCYYSTVVYRRPRSAYSVCCFASPNGKWSVPSIKTFTPLIPSATTTIIAIEFCRERVKPFANWRSLVFPVLGTITKKQSYCKN